MGIRVNTLMASDLGPTLGRRGIHFPEHVGDNGGWDGSYLWAELLFLLAAAYLWWLAWRYTRPDNPVQWPEYMSTDVLNQIGGPANLAILSNLDF